MDKPQLNRKRAFECENALEARCRCRCGGKLHGAKRLKPGQDLHSLPTNDPHYVPKATDTGLRAIVKLVPVKARLKKHKSFIAHLACGHTMPIAGSRVGPNRSRAHCETCRPHQVMQARQRRAAGMDISLMKFFDKHDRDKLPKRSYAPSHFETGYWHVVDKNEPDRAVTPGVLTRSDATEIAKILNRQRRMPEREIFDEEENPVT